MSDIHHTILIDPFTHTFDLVEIPDTGWRAIAALIGDRPITRTRLSPRLDLWSDDEGLLRKGQHYFIWKSYPTPFAGKAILLGFDDRNGESYGLQKQFRVGAILSDLPNMVRFIGTSAGVEAAIAAGQVQRPESTVNGEVFWSWTPASEDRP